MNFRRDEFAVKLDLSRFRRDFRWTGWLAAAAAVFAFVTFGLGIFFDARRAEALEEHARQLFPGSAPASDAVGAMSARVRDANARADFLGVYRGNLSALDVLTKLSQQVPKNLEIGLEELIIERQTIRMKVQTQDFKGADRLRTELSKYAPFASTNIGPIDRDAKTGNKRFSVTISLQENRE